MRDKNLRHVLYFTLAWGAFAALMIAAQPGPFMHGIPHFVKPAEAATAGPPAKAQRILLAASLENVE